MKFGPVPLAQAAGCLLAHGQQIGRRRLPKGHVLGAADLAEAAATGLAELIVAQLEPGDVAEDDAAAALAAALAAAQVGPQPSSGLAALAPVHGRVNLAATVDGLFSAPPGMVAAVNAVDEALTLAALPNGSRVTAGAIVATIKTIRYAVAQTTLAAAVAAAKPLHVHGFRPLSVGLIATTLPGTSAKALAKLERVTAARIAALGSHLDTQPPCPHDSAALAAVLAGATADLLLVAGASATVDRGDVIPQAIIAAGGVVERLGMPVDPGNLLVLGRIGGRPVIGLPGCAKSPKRNGLDLVLERLAAGLPVTAETIAAMGDGGLLPEAERPEPRGRASAPATVGAVVLAAGRASRMGGPHKLLEDWRGQPIIAHVIDAIAAAGLPPPIIVLGHAADAVRHALSGRPARFVTAADWAEGMGRSLAAGIAAVPAEWDAALVFLADMPRIEPTLIATLAATPGQIVLPSWEGRRGHPVRWPRAAFAQLIGLAGDVGGRAVMADYALTPVPALSDAVLDDIDTPAALAALRNQS
ncbi:NTP transferase domain-containing protein [Sandarakinorhabdus sp.]|uniref:NTP transferase domain-containing protein n=1 Tax=Sandarakinorhabdus sp. TaxID=1916663 RepID=UPI00286DBCB4|nr:NTP transferase domain-containing protein [Sandarakinorhabdus sp.]